MTTIAEEVRRAYERGEIPVAMDMARDAITKCRPDDPELPALWVLLGWCHYRHQEYDVVRSCLQEAGDIEPALELAGYLAAYVDKDDVRLQEIAGRLPGSTNVQNALILFYLESDIAGLGAGLHSINNEGMITAIPPP